MGFTSNRSVLAMFKRDDSGRYSVHSTDTLSDGDMLWWVEAGVVFQIISHDGALIAIADPDPLIKDELSLELQII